MFSHPTIEIQVPVFDMIQTQSSLLKPLGLQRQSAEIVLKMIYTLSSKVLRLCQLCHSLAISQHFLREIKPAFLGLFCIQSRTLFATSGLLIQVLPADVQRQFLLY